MRITYPLKAQDIQEDGSAPVWFCNVLYWQCSEEEPGQEIFLERFAYISCVWLSCLHVCIDTMFSWCLPRSEEVTRSPGTGVINNCEPHVDARNHAYVL